ncbi:choline dehydrogenase-like flavoprotein [Brevibacterium epidermidis]|jgi:choline dehydrogenase-like flavoprotein|uniref:Choline dehydrogenase-like flavoprotein n=2 Tax=Brevibacterium epidermidis TaxID=1698 RepID=A0ABV4EJ51_BREEP
MMTESTDVLIIGGGLSGAVTAATLSGNGFDVLCLEQGDWPDYSHPVHPLEIDDCPDSRWSRMPNERGSAGDYPIDATESSIEPLMWNGVGGSSVLYLAKWHRMLPEDFQLRTLTGAGEDWPFGYSELEPYYTEAERQFLVGGLAGDPDYPEGGAPPLPPLPMREFGHRLVKGFDSLGWKWWPSASAVFPREEAAGLPYGPEEPLGTVSTGDNRRTVKASSDVTHWPGALRAGARLETGAQVRQIVVEKGRATGADFVDSKGRTRRVAAEHVILCANGIGTPRLLLASDEGRGIANSSGLVGRNLMMHPLAALAGVFDSEIDGAVSPLGAQLQSTHFYSSDPSRGFIGGAKWGLQPAGGAASHLLSYPWTKGTPVWGDHFADSLRERLGHSAMFSIVTEDLPHTSNRVVLDHSRKDRAGGPGAKIEYALDDNSRTLLKFHIDKVTEVLKAAGAREVVVDPLVRASGWHLIGTTRMGEDPSTSVVDQFGTAHDIPNLHVFDSSTWPTSSGFNPAASQAAIALRSSNHFLEEASW